MSSILKALKKLENEKAARRVDAIKIDADILRGDASPPLPLLKLTLVAVLLIVCGGGATYLYMKGSLAKPDESSQTSTPTIPEKDSPSTPTLPVERITANPVVPASKENISSGNSLPRHSREATAPPLEQKKLKAAISKPINSLTSSITQVAPSVRMSEVRPQLLTEKQLPLISSETAGHLPTLKVSGIAYQDGIDSVAMINGIPVTKGSVIEGVRVENIHRNSVQFVYGVERFEIGLGRSNR